MRFLDIALASAYAAVCLSLLVTMSPVASRESMSAAASQSTLDSAIYAYVERVGLPFLASSQPGEVCASAAHASNSSLVMGVTIDGAPCAPPPGHPIASSSILLELSGRTLEIQAWLERR